MKIQLIGYQPDLDPTQRDMILLDVNKQAQESRFGGGLAVRVA